MRNLDTSVYRNPRLVCIAGPREGTVFALSDCEFSIGREPTNQLSISDRTLSRRHCLIEQRDEQFQISDLDSHNGTFVNRVPIKERFLEHGDEIHIGRSTFLFLVREEEPQWARSVVELDEGTWVNESTLRLPVRDPRYLRASETAAPGSPAERTVDDLSSLLRISNALGSLRSLEALEQKLLDSIFEITPADRGAVILVGETPGDFTSIFGRDRFPEQEHPVHVSRPAIDQALRERTAILSNDLHPKSSAPASEATLAGEITSLMVVPLVVFDRTVGVIYLDTSNPAARFNENHLQLLTAVGPIAAMALENVRRLEWLETENQRLHTEIDIEHNMIGESAGMKAVYQFIAKVAPTDSTVLVCGESGTGKELVARAIHRNSRRADQPFVAINCAALTETLLESEMFGHEKGAFTGAIAQKKGKLEAANGGTVFLDEVAELAPALQAKLLRVLQEREFERVGGTRPIRVDMRLIAATNKNLEDAVKEKSLRQDLYYRLNVVSLTLPPLRERREDISLLASYFIAKHGEKSNRHLLGLSAETRSCLLRYDWPGNVRELENAIERAVVLSSGDVILPENLPDSVLEMESPEGAPIPKYHEAIREKKKQLILEALELASGNYTEAAKALGVHPNYLHRLIKNMNLKTQIKARAS